MHFTPHIILKLSVFAFCPFRVLSFGLTTKVCVFHSPSVQWDRQTYILQPQIHRMPWKSTLQNILCLHISILNLL